jgi:hypothetical protein
MVRGLGQVCGIIIVTDAYQPEVIAFKVFPLRFRVFCKLLCGKRLERFIQGQARFA